MWPTWGMTIRPSVKDLTRCGPRGVRNWLLGATDTPGRGLLGLKEVGPLPNVPEQPARLFSGGECGTADSCVDGWLLILEHKAACEAFILAVSQWACACQPEWIGGVSSCRNGLQPCPPIVHV